MKVNEILNQLEKQGFTNSRAYRIVNIAHDGGWMTGKYLGPVEFKDDDGDIRINHKFAATAGEGLLNKGDKTLGKIEPQDILIFGSGSLNYKMKEIPVGKDVAVVYNGMDTFKKGKKDVTAHSYEVRVK